jgi:rhodanese-related sulfurtransferase
VVVTCHHGMRAARAGRILRQHGFARVENLAGGIEAWSLTVDPSVPRY